MCNVHEDGESLPEEHTQEELQDEGHSQPAGRHRPSGHKGLAAASAAAEAAAEGKPLLAVAAQW